MGEAESIDIEELKAGYAAIALQDWDRVEALYDPGIEWTDPPEIPGGGTHVGLEAVRASWAQYTETLEDWALDPQEVLVGEDDILVRSRVGGRARHTGIPIDLELYQVWTARDGRLVRHRAFLDRKNALAAAGLPPD